VKPTHEIYTSEVTVQRLVYREMLLLPIMAIIGLSGAAWAAHAGSWPHSTCGLSLSAFLAAYIIHETWRHQHLNRAAKHTALYPTLGWANLITAGRGLLLALLAGFLCSGTLPSSLRWIPGILFTLNILADFVDGLIARVTRRPSLLGAHLDMHLDSLGVLIAAFLVVRFGQMPWWYALVGLARYIFLAGETLLRALGHPTQPMPPSPTRRALAGIQMTFLAITLYPFFHPPATKIIGTFLFLPFILGFVRDFLAIAGWAWPVESTWFRLAYWRQHALPFIRWVTGGLLLWYTWAAYPALRAYLPFQTIFLQTLIAFLLLSGIISRLHAALLLILVALHITLLPERPLHLALIAGGTIILLWGGGRYSLWAPDETLFLKRLGAP